MENGKQNEQNGQGCKVGKSYPKSADNENGGDDNTTKPNIAGMDEHLRNGGMGVL